MRISETAARLRRARLGPLALGLGVAALALGREQSGRSAGPAASAGASVERGRYLTHDVAMCVQCHSPRDDSGRLIESQEFRGAPMPLKSPYRGVEFALRAPDLRGLADYSEDAVVRLLETGIARDGNRPQLPMPPFHMSHEDAQSIAMYLHSLR